MINKPQVTPRNQLGTGLIEVMVAAIIIGSGLLGIAALQATALQASANAEIRARATDFASEMADRVRANLAADNCYCRNTPACVPGAPAPACSTSVTARGIATNDLAAMDAAIAAPATGLPGGAMTITCNDKDGASATPDADPCSEGSTMTITIAWLIQRDVFGGNQDMVVMPFIPGAEL